MLRCDQIAELLFDYVENDLDDVTIDRVEAHLSSCPDCHTFVDEYAAVRGLVHSNLELSLDAQLQAELDAAVLAAIAQADRQQA